MRFDGFFANLVGPLLELEARVGDTSGMAGMEPEPEDDLSDRVARLEAEVKALRKGLG